MVFENSGFYLKEALHSIKRNILINIATFISFTTILIILGAFLLIYANMNLFLKNMESQLEIIAYLEDNISEKEINGLN
ncbi:MAG: ABC transporter permease, partial [Candidatus Atribacteria bacterium]|nr:ABC transporter permease [Candidatus Atribacteria bacterium]